MQILNTNFANFKKKIIDELIKATTNNEQLTISAVLKKYNSYKELQKYYLSNYLSKKDFKVVNKEEIFNKELSNDLKLIPSLIVVREYY